MKKIILTGAVALAMGAAAVAAERVAFFGDSITHGGKYVAILQLFENLRHPGRGTRYLNVGRSGGDAGGAIKLLECDLYRYEPTKVVTMLGMNDVRRDLYAELAPKDANEAAGRARALANYRTRMTTIAEKLAEKGIPLVLMTPTPYDSYGTTESANYIGCNEIGVTAAAAAMREVAGLQRTGLIELHHPLTKLLREHGTEFTYAKDRVHADWEGHLLAASLILDAFGETNAVAETVVEAKDGAAAFDYAPAALPYPDCPEYAVAERYFGFTAKHNRELLTVKGLPEGRYELAFDGKRVGEYSAAEFARGVNIALLETPNQLLARKQLPVMRELQKSNSDYRRALLVENMLRLENVDPDDRPTADKWLDAWLERQKNASYYRGILDWVVGWRRDRDRKAELAADCERLYAELEKIRPLASRVTVSAAATQR